MPRTASYRPRGTHTPSLTCSAAWSCLYSRAHLWSIEPYALCFDAYSFPTISLPETSQLQFLSFSFSRVLFLCQMVSGFKAHESHLTGTSSISYRSLQKAWAASFKTTSLLLSRKSLFSTKTTRQWAAPIAWCFHPLGQWKGKVLMIWYPFCSWSVLLEGDNLIGTLLLEHFNSKISDRNVCAEALGHFGRVDMSCGGWAHRHELWEN